MEQRDMNVIEVTDLTDRVAKVVLLGDTNVGKTSLLRRMAKDKFNENEPDTKDTYYTNKRIDYQGYIFEYRVWDTPHPSKYDESFYADAQVALLVYDITDSESFRHLKPWVEKLQNRKERILIILVGNKDDSVDEQEAKEEEVLEYADSVNVVHRFTSALDGTGIEEIFNYISDTLEWSQNDEVILTNDSAKSTEVPVIDTTHSYVHVDI